MKPFKIIVAILALLAVVALFLPWKSWVESGLKSALAARGLAGIDFKVYTLGFEGITIKDVTFGDTLRLSEMTVAYSLYSLASTQFRELQVSEMDLEFGERKFQVKDAVLVFTEATYPSRWQGTWTVGAVEWKDPPYPLPPLSGKGDFKADTKKLTVQGELRSADKSHHATFHADHDLGAVEKSRVIVSDAAMPWNGGKIYMNNGLVTFAGKQRFKGKVNVQNASLDTLLRSLTGDRAGATGVVSGTVPLAVEQDGTILVDGGVLKAPEAGAIKLAPDAIPGDNEQIGVVRNVLSNFQYRELNMTIGSSADKKISVTLRLEGNNPDMYNGRAVKLNVHLTGDVLSLLQQSVPTFTDPKHLLKNR